MLTAPTVGAPPCVVLLGSLHLVVSPPVCFEESSNVHDASAVSLVFCSKGSGVVTATDGPVWHAYFQAA